MTLEKYEDKEKGVDLPMFSRVGKTTVSMYLAFSSAAQQKKQEEQLGSS